MSKIQVIRGAKIVTVTENELDKYLSKGYVIRGEKLGSEPAQPTPKVEKATPVAKTEPKSFLDTEPTSRKRNRKK